jgi:hypothetical protein
MGAKMRKSSVKRAVAFLLLVVASFGLSGCFLVDIMAIKPLPTNAVVASKTIQSPTQAEVQNVVAGVTERPKCVVLTGIPDGKLNMRAGAGTEYPMLVVLAETDELDYLGQDNNGWKFVEYRDKRGWVFGDFVKGCE